jgi:hypothetical protein
MQSGSHMHFSQCAQMSFCYLLEATSLAIYIAEDITRAARLRFRDQSTAIMERLRGGEKIPRPTKWSDQNAKCTM